MDRGSYWMWTSTNAQFDSVVNPNQIFARGAGNRYDEDSSWEERAFAEDTAGCVWPPRSYSCTFCRREFKSAQALGGHMNVHRRDRARLKQSLSLDHLQEHHDHHRPSIDVQSPILSNVTRVSSTDEAVSKEILGWKFDVEQDRVLDSINGDGKRAIVSQTESRVEKADCVITEDLSTCLSLVTCNQGQTTNASSEEEVGSFVKRRRVNNREETPPSNFFPKSCFVDRCLPQSGSFTGLVEDVVDLELRLGHIPKVK